MSWCLEDCFLFFGVFGGGGAGGPCHAACGILVPRPGIEPAPPTGEAWSLNRWTTTEVPRLFFQTFYSYFFSPLTSHHFFSFNIYIPSHPIQTDKTFASHVSLIKRKKNVVRQKLKQNSLLKTTLLSTSQTK